MPISTLADKIRVVMFFLIIFDKSFSFVILLNGSSFRYSHAFLEMSQSIFLSSSYVALHPIRRDISQDLRKRRPHI